ncbi:MAG: Fur family transcriptional regulator [Acidimicrobiales bacterium]
MPTSRSLSADQPSSRSTRQGEAVMRVLASSEGFRSAQDIHAELRIRGERVGLTTVYRHLQLLSERGALDVLRNDDGESTYRRCASAKHHHHLVCRSCGASVEIEGPEVEAWAGEVAGRLGYRDVSHTIEVYGICPACS